MTAQRGAAPRRSRRLTVRAGGRAQAQQWTRWRCSASDSGMPPIYGHPKRPIHYTCHLAPPGAALGAQDGPTWWATGWAARWRRSITPWQEGTYGLQRHFARRACGTIQGDEGGSAQGRKIARTALYGRYWPILRSCALSGGRKIGDDGHGALAHATCILRGSGYTGDMRLTAPG